MTELDSLAPHARGDEAARFIEAWHGVDRPDWLISVVQLRPKAPVRTICAPVGEVVEVLRNGDLDELAYAGGAHWNLYHSAGFQTEKPPKGLRGGKRYVRGVPGVWLDLDVKEGCFRDREHALTFLRSIPVAPTITLDTGSGGVHAYWKTSKILTADQADELCVRWWEYCRRLCDVNIDKIQNPDRIMRLPGSVRWPKKDEQPTLARLLWVDGPVVEVDTLLELTHAVWLEREQRTREARLDIEESRKKAVLSAAAGSGWGVLMAITNIEDTFNETYSWPYILEPHGWTVIGEDHEGRTIWSRPGGDGRKSATTDWVESPHVMSLFSDSEETGLRRLADAEVPLTKYRVYVELTWRGDEAGFVNAWVRQLREEGTIGADGDG